ncbi:hypothetical protein R0J89_19990, partial [Psychrobacter sp. SIMBA_152]
PARLPVHLLTTLMMVQARCRPVPQHRGLESFAAIDLSKIPGYPVRSLPDDDNPPVATNLRGLSR